MNRIMNGDNTLRTISNKILYIILFTPSHNHPLARVRECLVFVSFGRIIINVNANYLLMDPEKETKFDLTAITREANAQQSRPVNEICTITAWRVRT